MVCLFVLGHIVQMKLGQSVVMNMNIHEVQWPALFQLHALIGVVCFRGAEVL